MKERFIRLWRWLDERLQVGDSLVSVAEHPVPRSSASWWYVFGSATLVVFVLQVVTGICLATVYTPAADRAWDSLIYLDYHQPLGWYLRALHGWGSNFMVALMLVHMIQSFCLVPTNTRASSPGWQDVFCSCARSAWRSRVRCSVSIRTHTGDSASAPRSLGEPRSLVPR